jgi:Outer membrane protein beta-barrel domain
MSNLKDTDTDDLFRRASDKYPLRTDSGNWDRMAAALDKEPPAPPNAADAEEKRKKRRFFWLFLLLPLAGAGYYAWHHTGHTEAAGTKANNVTATSVSATNATATGATAAGTPAAATAAGAPAKPAPPATANPATSVQLATAPATAAPATAAQSQPKIHATHTAVYNNATEEDTQPDNSLSLTAANTRQQPGGESIGSESIGGESIATQNRKGGVEEDRLFYDLQRAPIPHDYHLAVNVTAPAAKKDTTKSKTQTRTKHFYAGIFGSPDLSTVKMQSVKGVGSTFGVILGYTFNGGHWAIETGANLDRKKYYTDGEYFNTKEVNLPLNSYLTEVNGICYMWEIPLNVRYNFNPGAKTSWFATAGFSTYLMSHEKYAYGLQWSGSTAVYDSSWNIHKPSQYPFSIVNLSAGFEQRLGKIGNLRVEPYVRLPLTGLGAGKLSIMSAGVNIGITRQLW